MSEFEPLPPAPPEAGPTGDSVRPDDAAPLNAAPVDAAPAPPRRSRRGAFFLGAFSGCLLLTVLLFAASLFVAFSGRGSGEISLSTQKVAVIPVEGEIMEARDTVEAIQRHADNSSIKAVVVRINSPGGAIAPSQEIYSEILKARKKSGKPFVASMDSVAASGGYYIAAACDEIVANPGTITGSIGVVMQWLEIEDLIKWLKMKPETITSGDMKAAGSPYRELSEQERAYLQRIVLQLHGQFVRAVAAGRKGKISEAEVSRVADGRVFTGEEALGLKLVDRLGTLDDAVEVAARRAGIEGEPTKVYPRRREGTLLDLLTDTGEAESVIERIITRRAARFLYRWQ